MARENSVEMVKIRRPCFYEIFSSNLTSNRLEIPLKFVEYMEGKTRGSVTLMGPSGNTWVVDLLHQNDDLFLDHGWPTFVRDHFIVSGDLLVFRYDGDLCFTVQVFDQSSCEKEAAFHSSCSQTHTKFCEKVCHKRRRKGEVLSSEEYYGAEDGTSETCSSCLHHGFEETSMINRKSSEDVSLVHDGGYVAVFSEREKRVAESFVSCFPYFVRIMKKFNVSGSYTLNVPYQFSMAHLPNCKTEIILRTIKGVRWTVNSVPTTRVNTSHTFCGGWMAFVRNNDISVGDICIFELVQKLELRVFILRAGTANNQSEKLTSNMLNIELCTVTNQSVSVSKKLSKISSKTLRKRIKKVHSLDIKGSKGSQPSKIESKHSEVDTTSSAEEGMLSGSTVRIMVVPDEKKIAKSFNSDFPHFVRVMRKFNVSGSYTLKVPHQFSATYLPNFKAEIVLRDTQGKCWIVNCVPDSKGRKVHTLCGGWMAFARDNDLKIGDICIFELVNKCEMLVHISEIGRTNYDNQCAKSASNSLSLLVSDDRLQ